MKKNKTIVALTALIATLSLIGLLSNTDVVKSAYCWDCFGGCQKCVYDPGTQEYDCAPETVRNNWFCFCSQAGGGSELCNLSYDKLCAQAH